MVTTKRIIGLTHRVKQTVEDKARPTLCCILDLATGKSRTYELETEDDEADLVLGHFPIKYQKVPPDFDLTAFVDRQIKGKRDKDTGELLRTSTGELLENVSIPIEFDGLRPGDLPVIPLGGSGDYFAYALTKQAIKIGAEVRRLKPSILKEQRGTAKKDEDHVLLATLGRDQPDLFQPVSEVDLNQILVKIRLNNRMEAMKARIGCEQRMRQALIGEVFTSPKGILPEGSIKKALEQAKSNDKILQGLIQEEALRERQLAKVVTGLPVYEQVFEPIEGCGVMIAARLIAAIGNVKRFATAAKLKAFCGVHVLSDGSFVRRRAGKVASWSQEARQALWLLIDQMNRRPGSVWGIIFREYKAKFRAKHPAMMAPSIDHKTGLPKLDKDGQPVMVSKYSDGHIHKMAGWRTATKFVEYLFREWDKLDNGEKSPTQGNGPVEEAA